MCEIKTSEDVCNIKFTVLLFSRSKRVLNPIQKRLHDDPGIKLTFVLRHLNIFLRGF